MHFARTTPLPCSRLAARPGLSLGVSLSGLGFRDIPLEDIFLDEAVLGSAEGRVGGVLRVSVRANMTYLGLEIVVFDTRFPENAELSLDRVFHGSQFPKSYIYAASF